MEIFKMILNFIFFSCLLVVFFHYFIIILKELLGFTAHVFQAAMIIVKEAISPVTSRLRPRELFKKGEIAEIHKKLRTSIELLCIELEAQGKKTGQFVYGVVPDFDDLSLSEKAGLIKMLSERVCDYKIPDDGDHAGEEPAYGVAS